MALKLMKKPENRTIGTDITGPMNTPLCKQECSNQKENGEDRERRAQEDKQKSLIAISFHE